MAELTFSQMSNLVYQVNAKLDRVLEALDASASDRTNPAPEYLTLPQAAELLNRSPSTIYGLINRKEIPHLKNGKRLSFKRSELVEWLESGRRKTNAQDLVDVENQIIKLNTRKK